MDEPKMNRDDIIHMAREAGYGDAMADLHGPALERFAALVAAAERESILKDGWRQCAKDQRTTQFCGMVEQAVLAEREACAKVAEAYEPRCDTCPSGAANAIRRRSLIDSIVQNERSARGQNDGH
jgi:hypothetical protein